VRGFFIRAHGIAEVNVRYRTLCVAAVICRLTRYRKEGGGLIPYIPGFDVEVYLVLDDFGRVVGRIVKWAKAKPTGKR
jgi:hypothetical protein